MSRLIRINRHRDRGAVAVIVTILLATGVLMGLGALVVDVGQLYGEREELQSGADSAAYAVALDCAMKRTACQTASNDAKTYANSNAKDGFSAIDSMCGTDPNLTSTCVSTGGLGDCLGARPTSGNYVEVHTKTEVSDGDFLLPFSFAQTLTGVGKGRTVHACSRVAYGSPTGGFALTFSFCEYNAALQAPVKIVTGTPVPSDDTKLYTHGSPPAGKCTGPSGSELPGGFGWTTHNSSCVTTIDSGGVYDSDTGNGTPNDCKDELESLVASRTPVAIPIFKKDAGTGANGTYTLQGFAAFVITGWNLPGMSPKSKDSWLNPSNQCNGNDDCIYGYFTTAVLDWDGSFGTTPIMGAVEIKTIG